MQRRNLFGLTKSLNFDAGEENREKPSAISFEDLRGMVDSMPVICDQEGIQFIYGTLYISNKLDAALRDREELESILIKASTIYINKEIIGEDVGKSYVDELRFRMSDRKSKHISYIYYRFFRNNHIYIFSYEFVYRSISVSLRAIFSRSRISICKNGCKYYDIIFS